MAKWTFLRGIEEAFFKQKSRINWLHLGDQNTTFFIRVAASRRAFNSFRSLLLASGILVTDPSAICQIALDHLRAILAPSSLPQLSSPLQWLSQLIPFRCSESQSLILSSPPTSEEIQTTIFKLNPHKSPGPDGFTSAFFKDAWTVVGAETIAAIHKFFATAFLPAATNATILTLVPKRPVLLQSQTSGQFPAATQHIRRYQRCLSSG